MHGVSPFLMCRSSLSGGQVLGSREDEGRTAMTRGDEAASISSAAKRAREGAERESGLNDEGVGSERQ